MRQIINSSPLALACWDMSWLLRRTLPHGEYGSLERVLDETQLRGFNALRVDPCPHLLATPDNSVHMDRCELHPEQGPAVEVKIRHQFQQLLQSAHERGMKLWLTSQFVNDSRARRSFVRRPEDFVAVWSETLSLIQEWGYLDTIAAVDFCYQFPAMPYAHGLARRVFNRSPEKPIPNRWVADQERQLERYLLEVPRALRTLFPTVPVGISSTVGLAEQLRQLETSELDFIDLSLWLDDDPRYRLASGQALPVPGMFNKLAGSMRHLLLEAGAMHWQQRLEKQLQRRLSFIRIRGLQPVLGGGFVQVPRELKRMPSGWADLHEMMVVNSLTEGVNALTIATAASPHYPWLWREQDYLNHLNRMILAGKVPQTAGASD